MARSTDSELGLVSEALVKAKEYMVGQYFDFLQRLGPGLSPETFLGILKQGIQLPPDHHPITPYRTDDGVFDFVMDFNPMTQVGSARGLGMKMERQPSSSQAPQSIGVAIVEENPGSPMIFSYTWELKGPDVINFLIASEDARVRKLAQHTHGDFLFQSIEPPLEGESKPFQSLDIEFGWDEDTLTGWVATFGLPQSRFKPRFLYQLHSSGAYGKGGDLTFDYELPKGLIMPDVIENIINHRPALLAAYYP